jgi:hypothetical protein
MLAESESLMEAWKRAIETHIEHADVVISTDEQTADESLYHETGDEPLDMRGKSGSNVV